MRMKFRRLKRRGKCYFCENKAEPNFREFDLLRTKFISDRGKILSRLRTGTCSAHQRKVTRAVKRARFLSLVPFAVKI